MAILAQLSDPHLRLPPGDQGSGAALEAALEEDRETPTIVAMHHPPILTGIGGLDEIGLTVVREPPAFAVHALVDGELVSHLQPI